MLYTRYASKHRGWGSKQGRQVSAPGVKGTEVQNCHVTELQGGPALPSGRTAACPSPVGCRGPRGRWRDSLDAVRVSGRCGCPPGNRSVAPRPPEQPCWGAEAIPGGLPARGQVSHTGQPLLCCPARPMSPGEFAHCPQEPLQKPPAEPKSSCGLFGP